jgi:hypothetical protein
MKTRNPRGLYIFTLSVVPDHRRPKDGGCLTSYFTSDCHRLFSQCNSGKFSSLPVRLATSQVRSLADFFFAKGKKNGGSIWTCFVCFVVSQLCTDFDVYSVNPQGPSQRWDGNVNLTCCFPIFVQDTLLSFLWNIFSISMTTKHE